MCLKVKVHITKEKLSQHPKERPLRRTMLRGPNSSASAKGKHLSQIQIELAQTCSLFIHQRKRALYNSRQRLMKEKL